MVRYEGLDRLVGWLVGWLVDWLVDLHGKNWPCLFHSPLAKYRQFAKIFSHSARVSFTAKRRSWTHRRVRWEKIASRRLFRCWWKVVQLLGRKGGNSGQPTLITNHRSLMTGRLNSLAELFMYDRNGYIILRSSYCTQKKDLSSHKGSFLLNFKMFYLLGLICGFKSSWDMTQLDHQGWTINIITSMFAWCFVLEVGWLMALGLKPSAERKAPWKHGVVMAVGEEWFHWRQVLSDSRRSVIEWFVIKKELNDYQWFLTPSQKWWILIDVGVICIFLFIP